MATLKDVAEAAGVTVTTVSRVLNNRGYISEKTRENVYRVMKELNYQPNEMARALAKKQSNLLAVVVPHVEHPYFARMIDLLEKEANQKGYKLLLFNSQGSLEMEEQIIDSCRSSRVAGMIICTGTIEMERFRNAGLPIVTFERSVGGDNPSVECDNYQGGLLAGKALIAAGCRKILYVGGQGASEEVKMPADVRLDGFLSQCKAGVTCVKVYAPPTNFEQMKYKELLLKELKKNPDIDGIFATSDLIGAQAISVCHKLGKKVPGDVKIISFDDTIIAEMTDPPLTSIHQPLEKMCQQAIIALISAASGDVAPTRVVFPVSLTVRESV